MEVGNYKLKNMIHTMSRAIWVTALFLLVAPLNAQQDELSAVDDDSPKFQRSYLLNLMIYSDDPAEKRLAIQQLEQLIETGTLSQDDRLTIDMLVRLALQGVSQKSYDTNGNLVNNNFIFGLTSVICWASWEESWLSLG